MDLAKGHVKALKKFEQEPQVSIYNLGTGIGDATKAKEELGWVAEKGIKEMCADSWKWQSMNPDGYRTEK